LTGQQQRVQRSRPEKTTYKGRKAATKSGIDSMDIGRRTMDGGRWTWDLKIGGQRWGDQVKRNKSSRPVAESHND